MINHRNRVALLILVLSSFNLLLTLALNPQLQKSYFSIAPGSPFSYEFPQTHNGIIAHYFDNPGPSKFYSRYILFNLTSGDAYPVLEETASACQIASPIFQHIQYHVQTDTIVYYCAVNGSLLFIDQITQTVQSTMSLNLNETWPIAKLSTDGMNIDILAMDILFNANPKPTILIKVDMQSRQVASQILFNQSLTTAEAVVAYAPGSKASYIATNIWQNNSFITQVSSIIITGNTYQIFPLVNLTSTTKTITKLFVMENYIVVNSDTTLYFLNSFGMMVQAAYIRTKQLTAGIFHPAVVRSTDGWSLYLHTNTFEIQAYKVVDREIFVTKFGASQDMQVAHANQTSNDLIFTYDTSKVFFNILDIQTGKNIRTSIPSYNDLMLTNTTYTVVQTVAKTNTTTFSTFAFYIFDLKTDSLIFRVSILSSKYYYNMDQQIITFLTASQSSLCQATHLDLVSGKLWTTLPFSSPDVCSSYVSYARITEKGNPELVIPGNQSYFVVSETYGQIVFNTSSSTHDTDSINVNFDDLSFYYYTANQVLKQINTSYYTFNPQSKSFQLNSTKLLNLRPVKSHGFFTINPTLTVALSDLSLTLINQLDSQWYNLYTNNFNLATSFEDQSSTPYIFFSYLSTNTQYSLHSAPVIYDYDGNPVGISDRRDSTVSGQATGSRSFALYDQIYSSVGVVGVVRFFNSDPQDTKTLISI